MLLGNHAQATAYAAQCLSKEKGFPVSCTIVMPETAAINKVEGARQLGANVIVRGISTSECSRYATDIQQLTGSTLVPPAGDADVALGQGTATLEFMAQLKEANIGPLDAVAVPSGGGGLLAGVGIVCQNLPIRVFGTEPVKVGAELRRSRREGQRVTEIDPFMTIADGLRSPTAQLNREILKNPRLIDGLYAATDAEIKVAMQLVFEELNMMVERSAAVPLAVILFNEEFRLHLTKMKLDWTIGIILTEGNIMFEKAMEIFS
jgi:threonine dehydratase